MNESNKKNLEKNLRRSANHRNNPIVRTSCINAHRRHCKYNLSTKLSLSDFAPAFVTLCTVSNFRRLRFRPRWLATSSTSRHRFESRMLLKALHQLPPLRVRASLYLTPSQGLGALVGEKRLLPTGGVAYGIPRYTSIGLRNLGYSKDLVTPCTSP